jgi:D-glycero-D-manno-heptose 1,7-bisphosphate phosphatase
MMKQRRAIFLDRDGTLVHPYPYPSRPEHLCLYEHIGPELRRLQTMGFYLILVTNQSGIARGYFTEADLACMHTYLAEELAHWGVCINAIYYCPHHVQGTISQFAIPCNCRKPQPGMLFRAASEYALDLTHCWFVGDILDDVEAGNRAGCRTVLVDLGTEKTPTQVTRMPSFVARDTVHALQLIHTVTELSLDVDLLYHPPYWFMQTADADEHLSVSTEVRTCRQ